MKINTKSGHLWGNKTYNTELRSSELLCSKKWLFLADIGGQPLGLIFKGQESKNKFWFFIDLDSFWILDPWRRDW